MAAGDVDDQRLEALLSQGIEWLKQAKDAENVQRLQLNLSELYLKQAQQDDHPSFTCSRYHKYLAAIDCLGEVVDRGKKNVGKRELAFAHLRLGVHLEKSLASQSQLVGERSGVTGVLALGKEHQAKALFLFAELQDHRETAVCQFHLADLGLQEITGAPAGAKQLKARWVATHRHATKAAAFFTPESYPRDFVATHLLIAKLLALEAGACGKAFPKAVRAAAAHLAQCEKAICAHGAVDGIVDASPPIVPSFRAELGRICQAALKAIPEESTLWKGVYKAVLRKEPVEL